MRKKFLVIPKILFPLMIVSFIMTVRLAIAEDYSKPQIKVSLGIHSGLPNPGWVFENPEDIKRLQGFLEGLPERPKVPEPPFGYFLLMANNMHGSFPKFVVVFNNIIMVEDGDGNTKFYEDKNGLEAFLRAEAVKHGLGNKLK